jgi:hypothetical protein
MLLAEGIGDFEWLLDLLFSAIEVIYPNLFLFSVTVVCGIFSKHYNGKEPWAVKGDLSRTKLNAAKLLELGLRGFTFPTIGLP